MSVCFWFVCSQMLENPWNCMTADQVSGPDSRKEGRKEGAAIVLWDILRTHTHTHTETDHGDNTYYPKQGTFYVSSPVQTEYTAI